MEIFDFETVDSLPVLYRPETDLLVVSDLHLGLEGTLTSRGSYVPRFQLDDLKQDIETAVGKTGSTRILINGDLKQEFSTTEYSEREEIRELMEFLDERFEEIIIVKGNHDTFIATLVEEFGIELEETYMESGVLFAHGDSIPPWEFETLVIGHEHPALKLEDEIGVTEKIDCFLYGEMHGGKRIIVMPAFSSISEGSTVNQVPQKDLLSPVLREKVDPDSLKALGVSREAGMFKFPEIGKI